MNTIVSDLVDLSIKSVFSEDRIFTTPFNKNGIYDENSNIGECKFPFWEKNKKKFVYQCIPKNNGYMCPTKLDYNRQPDNWGYCPEKIETTKKNLKLIEIDKTEGDEDNNEYKVGKCEFPFISNVENIENDSSNYKLKYECNEQKTTAGEEFTWCPIKYNPQNRKKNKGDKGDKGDRGDRGDNEEEKDAIEEQLLLASDKLENIRIGKWYNGKLSLNKMLTKKFDKGYCNPPIKTKKHMIVNSDDEEDEDNKTEFEITLENYKPNNCNKSRTPSKGGYTKSQLKKFGIKYLKIPYTQLQKETDGITSILSKMELCKIINNKYREIITQTYDKEGITDKMRLDAYAKDIDNCNNGEAKGGYSLLELKNLAVSYFDLTEEQVKDMKKNELCIYINKYLRKINEKNKKADREDKDGKDGKYDKEENSNNDISNDKFDYIYEGDINLCVETPNRGGLSLKDLKKNAIYNFGIDVIGKNKTELCNEIKTNINNIKNKINIKDKKQDTNKYSKTTFNNIIDNDDDDDSGEIDKDSDLIFSKTRYSDDEDEDEED